MKKLLIILTLVLVSLFVPSEPIVSPEVPQSLSTSSYNTYEVIDYVGWKLSNNGCYGCSSFYYKITRSKYPNQYGSYTFDMWFSSNSYYPNGTQAGTYIWGIFLNVDRHAMNTSPFWVNCKGAFSPPNMRFTTSNPSPYVHISWQGHKIS